MNSGELNSGPTGQLAYWSTGQTRYRAHRGNSPASLPVGRVRPRSKSSFWPVCQLASKPVGRGAPTCSPTTSTRHCATSVSTSSRHRSTCRARAGYRVLRDRLRRRDVHALERGCVSRIVSHVRDLATGRCDGADVFWSGREIPKSRCHRSSRLRGRPADLRWVRVATHSIEGRGL